MADAGAQAREDAEDMAKAARGDAGALRRIFRRHGERAHMIAYRLTRDAALAEDAVQDAFLKLWRHAGRFDPEKASVKTWLSRITANAALDLLRRRKRDAPEEAAPEQVDDAPSPEAGLAERDIERAVRAALAGLPERQRQAVVLSMQGGLTAREVGEAMGLGERAAESLLTRARAGLRAALAETGPALIAG